MLNQQVTVLLSKQNTGRQNLLLHINASFVERLKKRKGSVKEGLIVALFLIIMKLNKSPIYIEFVSTS